MKKLLVISAALILSIIPLVAHASSGLARLTLTKGEVLLFDDDSGEWVPAAPNTPVVEGDRIWSSKGARAEIELKSGTILRLGPKTSIDFVRLDDEAQQLYLDTGRLYARSFDGDRDLQIDSEDATISVGRKSRVHVDLVGSGDPDTEVSVVKGTVYVESAAGKTRVRSGEDLIFSGNGAEVAPLNAPDEWERWNEKRDRKLQKRQGESRYLPEELAIYEEELASNGEWVTVEEYGYVWRPTLSVSIDWAPYQQGRWVWRRGGYIWIASEPWGWAPHHYGRWHHSPRFGWCWVPPRRGDVFWSPGYVAWVDTPRELAWLPLAPNEIYFGTGFYGSLSINISNVDRRTYVRQINSYRNVTVKNAVTVIDRTAFVSGKGKPRQGRPSGLDRHQGVPAPPQFRPSGREARMPQVRRVSAESRPPETLQRNHPSTMKERFPRLEQQRRKIPADKQTEAVNEPSAAGGQKRQQNYQPAASPAQAQPSRLPERERPFPDKRHREAVQPVQQAQPGSPEQLGRPQSKPGSGGTYTESRKGPVEQHSKTEPKPASPGRSETRKGKPLRVWQIEPGETSREAQQGEKQRHREQNEQKQQRDK